MLNGRTAAVILVIGCFVVGAGFGTESAGGPGCDGRRCGHPAGTGGQLERLPPLHQNRPVRPGQGLRAGHSAKQTQSGGAVPARAGESAGL